MSGRRGPARVKAFELRWVDAFSTRPLHGNACAVILDALGLDDAAMQAVARELNISETAFVFPGDAEADVNVRYFTPTSEVPMAGHPTIATTHALWEAGLVPAGRDVLRLRMPAGIVPVTIRPGEPRLYAMSQAPPQFLRTYEHERIAAALGLAPADLHARYAPQTVSTGTPQLMVPLASREALDRVRPVADLLFGDDRDWFSVHAFALGGGDVSLVARHFADFGEDPFTGSATGGMAGYCARYELLPDRHYAVAQGMHLKRPGRARVEVSGNPPHEIGRIVVAGHAVTLMRGTMFLPVTTP